MSELTLSKGYRGGILVASLGLMILSMGCTAYILMSKAPDFLSIPFGEYFAFAAGVFAEIFKNILIPVAILYIFKKKAILPGLSALAVGGLLLALSMWSTIQFFETGMLQDKQQAVVSNDRYQSLTQQIEVLDNSIVMQERVLESQLAANEAKLRINHITSSDATAEKIQTAQQGLSKLTDERRALIEERNAISVTSQEDLPDYSGYYLLFSIILDIAPLVGLIILDSDRAHRLELKSTQKRNNAVQSLIKASASPAKPTNPTQDRAGQSEEKVTDEGLEKPGEAASSLAEPEKLDLYEQYYNQVLDLLQRGELTPSIKNIREAVGCTEREARRINKTLKESDVLSDLAGTPA